MHRNIVAKMSPNRNGSNRNGQTEKSCSDLYSAGLPHATFLPTWAICSSHFNRVSIATHRPKFFWNDGYFILSACSIAMVPKLVWAVTQIKIAITITLNISQCVAHDIEQHCVFGCAFSPKNRILLLRGNLPPVWKPLFYWDTTGREVDWGDYRGHFRKEY